MKRCKLIVLGFLSLVVSLGTEGSRAPRAPTISYPASGTALVPVTPTASSGHRIDWYSLNGGGVSNATSASHGVGATIGQAAAGEALSPSHQMGLGFWYGTGAQAVPCACACHADPKCDGVTNVFDVVLAAGVAFRGEADIPDSSALCPRMTTDVDCDGVTKIFDVVHLVNVAFRGADPEMEFCDPCAP